MRELEERLLVEQDRGAVVADLAGGGPDEAEFAAATEDFGEPGQFLGG